MKSLSYYRPFFGVLEARPTGASHADTCPLLPPALLPEGQRESSGQADHVRRTNLSEFVKASFTLSPKYTLLYGCVYWSLNAAPLSCFRKKIHILLHPLLPQLDGYSSGWPWARSQGSDYHRKEQLRHMADLGANQRQVLMDWGRLGRGF